MRKRDLVLDFTSLLDVIMIILFAVISSIGFAANREVQNQVEKNEELQQELENLQNENEELQSQLETLIDENNLYKAKETGSDVDSAQLFESLMKKTQKITLICSSHINSNKSGENEVEITVYSGEAGEDQEELDTVIFAHNFDLTREERAIKNAEMQDKMYQSLKNIIKDSNLDLVLITIEFTYNDKNFSKADLDNIVGAVNDIERDYSVTCYIDKVKQ